MKTESTKSFKIVSINLNKYSTIEDFEKLSKDNGLSLIPEALVGLRSKYSKVYLATNLNVVVAVVDKNGEYKITPNMIQALGEISPLKMMDTPIDLNIAMDDILDKIYDKGIDSLSLREKYVLKKKSK